MQITQSTGRGHAVEPVKVSPQLSATFVVVVGGAPYGGNRDPPAL